MEHFEMNTNLEKEKKEEESEINTNPEEATYEERRRHEDSIKNLMEYLLAEGMPEEEIREVLKKAYEDWKKQGQLED